MSENALFYSASDADTEGVETLITRSSSCEIEVCATFSGDIAGKKDTYYFLLATQSSLLVNAC